MQNDQTALEAKNIIQSYIFSRVHGSLSIYELRLLVKVVEYAQCELQGFVIKHELKKKEHNLYGHRVEVPIKSIIPPGSHHYEDAEKAARGLLTKVVEHYSSDSGKWRAATIVSMVQHDRGTGLLSLDIHPWVWDCILDFTKGYVKYDMQVALRLSSPYALRLYYLMSNQPRKINYSIDELRRLMGTANKYPKNNDFIRRIIKPAADELLDHSPWACTYSIKMQANRINSILFFPFEQTEKYTPTLEEKMLVAKSGSVFTAHHVYQYLRYNIGFEHKELMRNKKLLEDFGEKHSDPIGFLAELNHRDIKSGRVHGKGWFINAMKNIIK